MYGPTDRAKKSPRTTFVDGVEVGIGGKVVRKRGIIPEATQKQYESLRHHKHLVQEITKTNDEGPRKHKTTESPTAGDS